MPASYWLIKSEPEAYGFDRLVEEGRTLWDGVRNYRARNNLQAMQVGDEAFFYHSVSDKEIVGVVRQVPTGVVRHHPVAGEQRLTDHVGRPSPVARSLPYRPSGKGAAMDVESGSCGGMSRLLPQQ